jgi:hypothetical protein
VRLPSSKSIACHRYPCPTSLYSHRNLSSNIDRLTRDIQSTRETTDKLRVLNPIGTEDDSSFTSMLTNAQVSVDIRLVSRSHFRSISSRELAQQKENFDKRSADFERTTVAYELIKRSVDDPNLYKDVYAMEKRVDASREQVSEHVPSVHLTPSTFSSLARTNTNQNLASDVRCIECSLNPRFPSLCYIAIRK